jgi:chorismate lyase / 3-hydroxybenzoate synthase
VLDAWLTSGALAERQHGCVRYATDGHWLHGMVEVNERIDGLQAASHRAYADLFEVLAANACPNLLRLWNYLAAINRETDGSERYRQFNAGRQQAFIEARRSAFEGSPAACALGTQGGPLRIYFLAGRTPPLAIENPRQVSAYRYPDAYGPRSPTFSRAALVDVGGGRQALFISGTASIVGHETVHVGDVRAQTEESLRNIATVRQVAAERAGTPFPAGSLIYTLYLRRPADLALVREVFEQAVGADSPAAREAVYLQADICRADLLVEIEAHGFAPTGETP